jgi:hypothetical protein
MLVVGKLRPFAMRETQEMPLRRDAGPQLHALPVDT